MSSIEPQSVAGSRTWKTQRPARIHLPEGVVARAGQWRRVIRAAWLHRSAEATASWWHLLSEDAVSEAEAAARRTAR